MMIYFVLIFQLLFGGLYAGGGSSASASASASAFSFGWGGGWGGWGRGWGWGPSWGWGGFGYYGYGYGIYPYDITGGFYLNPRTPGYSYWRLPKPTFTVQKNYSIHPLVDQEQEQGPR